jgi:energy-coupling factor transporter ATP-binding protein EcfA2
MNKVNSFGNSNELIVGERKLTKYDKINIILGKNGCGKSSLLRDLNNNHKNTYNITYVSPERAGDLTYNSNVIQIMQDNPQWLDSERNKNQVSQFKQQSYQKMLQIINIALQNYQSETEKKKQENIDTTLRELKIPTSDEYINKINKLLDGAFVIDIDKSGKPIIKDSNRLLSNISSGEAEIIALAAECLLCFMQLKFDIQKDTILLLDEPDVHLHPDLQYRFIRFLLDEIEDKQNIKIFIATHSTPILGALANYGGATVAFLKKNSNQESKEIQFYSINEQLQKILPVFGAHPLTSVYTESPLLLVEGDTDWMIWQQAIRSSEGKIKLYPVSCGTINKMNEYEKIASQVLAAIYNQKAKAFALRDKDSKDCNTILDEHTSVERLMLNCRESENLLLTDEVLNFLDTTWEEVKKNIDTWLDQNQENLHHEDLSGFKAGGYSREGYKIKNAINILLSFMNTNKPWTCIIGQVIGKLKYDDTSQVNENSIYKFLGSDLVAVLANRSSKKENNRPLA